MNLNFEKSLKRLLCVLQYFTLERVSDRENVVRAHARVRKYWIIYEMWSDRHICAADADTIVW